MYTLTTYIQQRLAFGKKRGWYAEDDCPSWNTISGDIRMLTAIMPVELVSVLRTYPEEELPTGYHVVFFEGKELFTDSFRIFTFDTSTFDTIIMSTLDLVKNSIKRYTVTETHGLYEDKSHGNFIVFPPVEYVNDYLFDGIGDIPACAEFDIKQDFLRRLRLRVDFDGPQSLDTLTEPHMFFTCYSTGVTVHYHDNPSMKDETYSYDEIPVHMLDVLRGRAYSLLYRSNYIYTVEVTPEQFHTLLHSDVLTYQDGDCLRTKANALVIAGQADRFLTMSRGSLVTVMKALHMYPSDYIRCITAQDSLVEGEGHFLILKQSNESKASPTKDNIMKALRSAKAEQLYDALSALDSELPAKVCTLLQV